MGELFHPTPADSVTILRAIRDFATDPTSDPPTSPSSGAADCLRQLHKVIMAGHLDNPRVLKYAGMTVADVMAMQARLDAIAKGGHAGN